MSNLLTMFDGTAPSKFPAVDQNALDVAIGAYCDLGFAGDWIGCVHKYPELSKLQRVLSIAGAFSTIARIIDYEPHNPCYGNPAGVVRWVETMVQHGIYRPGAYADRADMPSLQAEFVKSSLRRDQFVLWLAAPGVDPTPYLNEGFEAVQSKWLRDYDVSVVKPEFFPPLAQPTTRPAMTQGILKFAGELDTRTGGWTIQGEPNHGIEWGTDPRHWEAKLGVGNDNGQWRIDGLPFEAQ